MKSFEEMYTPQERRLMNRDPYDTWMTGDHFNPYYPRMTLEERMERNWYREEEPCINLRGWKTLRVIGIVLLIITVMALLFGREANASNLSIEDTLSELWALDDEYSDEAFDDWDVESWDEDEWLVPAPASERSPKANEFPEVTVYSGAQVEQIQTALARAGYRVKATEVTREVFGRNTAKAVKKFQIANGLEPSGVVSGETATLLGVEDSGAHFEADLSAVAEKSTEALIYYVSTNPRKESGPVLSIFYRDLDKEYQTTYWRLLAQYDCAIGAATESGNITPVGVFQPTFFIMNGGLDGKSYYYQVGFTSELAILSVGYDFGTKLYDNWQVDHFNEDRRAVKGRLTGGSVRVAVEVAKWLYENAESGTYIVIDDRNYG